MSMQTRNPRRTSRPRLTRAEVGAWLIKSRTPVEVLAPGWLPGTAHRLRRCLHPSYRVGLVTPGDPCLLWVSGSPGPGVQAVGEVAEPPEPAAAEPGRPPEVGLLLWRLVDPVPRAELRADPDLAALEVLRMPAGSNPSYLSPAAFRRVTALVDLELRLTIGGAWVRGARDLPP